MIWSLLFLLCVLALIYLLVVRPVLHDRPELKGFYASADGFWAKVAVTVRGWRTIIVSRLQWIAGVVLIAHDAIASLAGQLQPYFGALDWTPVTARLLASVPDDLRPLAVSLVIAAVLSGFGALHEWLRRRTVGPVGEGSLAGPGA